ncbi:MAG: DUF481 domain-containing protein [Bacteriovoracia bacterium]
MARLPRIVLAILVIPFGAPTAARADQNSDLRTATIESVARNRKEWGVDLEVGTSLQRGNVDKSLGKFTTSLFKANDPYSVYLDGVYAFGAVGVKRFENRATGTLRLDYRMSPFWKIFVFTTHGFNEFQKLAYRGSMGAGPWVDFEVGGTKHGVSAAVSHEFEQFYGFAAERTARGSLRYLFFVPISENAGAGFDFFYCPSLGDFADHHLYWAPFLEAKVIDQWMTMKLSVSIERDSRPKPGVFANDTQTMVSIGFHGGK